ncbi:hypothetical protein MN086_05210 [Sulfurovum sp. XGS-02]|uniref:hypothetical protein n=1 Tax=Sulfurovum sp. XGS-02 TaxID=2925411 RepID=UPI00206666E3|nr:hypothetical protein [Sulfurovum sp. XGS-02]UPT78548.1 hypothetical protein MN086_05210 [Sulfurovum sp. XGS-02]
MQDKYVGDVGDFGKFQLFRYLFNHTESPMHGKALAQIWYMHEGEGEKNNDGRHIDYFERMMGCDKELEDSLLSLIMRDKREVRELESLKLLENAKFFYEYVPSSLEERYHWFKRALTFSHKSKVVAVAPDNGMALKCNRGAQCFEFLTLEKHYSDKVYPHKYVFTEEISHFYRLPHLEVCIVYQHLNRFFAHNGQIESLLSELRKEYLHVISIKHKPYSPRAFFFICKSVDIKESIERRLDKFTIEFSEFWELFR